MLVINTWNIYKIDKHLILYRIESIGSDTTLKSPLVSRIGNLFQKQLLVAFHLIPYIILFCPFLLSLPLSPSVYLSFLCPFSIPVLPLVLFLIFSSFYPSWLGFPDTASSNHRLQSTPPGTFQPTSRTAMEANCKSRATQVRGDSE